MRLVPSLIAFGLSLVFVSQAASVELQGHRGARGLWPENTLAGFTKTLKLGVDVLEFDLAMTLDDVIVVSHDPRLNPQLTRGPGGEWLPLAGAIIRTLPLRSLNKYDVGRVKPTSRYASRFSEQKPIDGQRVPTLVEVFDLVKSSGMDVSLNVEIKIRPHVEGVYPTPKHFAKVLVDTINKAGMQDRVTVQGFDWRPLAIVGQLAPQIPLVALTAEQSWLDNIQRSQAGVSPWTNGLDVDDRNGSVPSTVAALGAQVWSPFFRDITASQIKEAHKLGLKVIVWTVNQEKDIEAMLDMGVDGIISDYPDRARSVMAAHGFPLPKQMP